MGNIFPVSHILQIICNNNKIYNKTITILEKIAINFRQVSLNGVLLLVIIFRQNPSKVPVKKLNV